MYTAQGQSPPASGASYQEHCKYWTAKAASQPTNYNQGQKSYFCGLASGGKSGGSSGSGTDYGKIAEKGLDLFGKLFGGGGGGRTPSGPAYAPAPSGPPTWIYVAGIGVVGLLIWKMKGKKK